MRVSSREPLATLALAVVLASCARPADRGEARPPSASLGSSGVPPGAPSVAWSRKTREQRMEFMGLSVYPRMRDVFQSHDAESYAQFRCQTCHGEDMEARDFKMPSSLFALPEADPVAAALEHDAKTARLMVDEVVPEMRSLLGRNDPATAQRLSCFSCHQRR